MGRIQALDPPEAPYAVAFYESITYGLISVCGFTEEGLSRRAATYVEMGDSEFATADGREGIRWSCPDSPYNQLVSVTDPPLVSYNELGRLYEEWGDDYEDACCRSGRAARAVREPPVRADSPGSCYEAGASPDLGARRGQRP